MSNHKIAIEKKGPILIIRLSNPDKLNPLDIETGKELSTVLSKYEADSTVRAVIITGSGRSFSAGGDVTGMQLSIDDGKPGVFMDDLTRVLYDIGLQLRKYPKPVIAAVNGLAVGAGMNLALCSDFIIASDEARFSQSFCKVGLIPGFGGTHLLINQLSWQKAAELSFLGDMIDAAEMHRLGLVNRVVEHNRLEEVAIALAERLSKGPTLAYARTKSLFLEALKSGFEDHLEGERQVQVDSAKTEDYAIGVKSILEKSKPEFVGK